MIIDARDLTPGGELRAKVCIAGSGIAGITLALELSRSGIDTIVVESGGFVSDLATDDLSNGDNVGLPYAFDHNYRSRFFGGSSNCWGGWCRPFEPEDFAAHEWLAHSGWPLTRAQLQPYYDRTHAVLQLGPMQFDSDFWERAISRADVRRVPLRHNSEIADSFSQFSPPARLGRLYRTQLEAAPNIRIVLNANVVDIATDESARSVRHVDVATLSGRRFKVAAASFVLAMGGIENARVLLAANRVNPAGLGNDRDLVGRYFMDHPRLSAGSVKLREPWRRNRLYDIKYQDKTKAVHAHGTSVAAQLVVKPEVRQREQLLNARVWLRSIFASEGSKSVKALHRFTQARRFGADTSLDAWRDAAAIAKSPAGTAGYVLARFLPVWPLVRGISYEIMVEPDANPDSRVTLSRDRDALGMPRAQVCWKLGPLVQTTFVRTLAIVSRELHDAGVAEAVVPELFPDGAWPEGLQGTWHHMGTTRMSATPDTGVVDPQCRVHGIDNLYVAGSSVFPTAASNFPTMTLAALAIRLADTLVDRHRAGANSIQGTITLD